MNPISVHERAAQVNRDLMNAIQSQPGSMRQVLAHVRGQMQEARLHELVGQAETVFLTGCGDSYYAGLAAQQSFLKYTGAFTLAVEAMEFSRYLGPFAPRNSLLIGVSNSGRVSRTVEAAQLAGARHLGSIGITDAPDSPLARASTLTVSVGLTPMAGGATGTRSYLASLYTLYLLGLTTGRVQGKLTEADAQVLDRVLDESGEAIAATLELSRAAVEQVVPQIVTESVIYFMGAGPNYATANYGAAKLLEALAMSGVPVQLEEWAHEQFHIAGPDTTFIVLAPAGSGRDRALEQIQGLRDMQARVLVVGADKDTELRAASPYFIPVAGSLPEEFSPLEMCVPLQLLAANLAQARHTTMRMLTDDHKRDVNFRQIFHSTIIPS